MAEAVATPDDRLVPLAGGFNLRDFGGYPTIDGGTVRRGMLYRSGTMFYLTEAEERHLAGMGFAAVCDLRRRGERAHHPTRWCEAAGTEYWFRDHEAASGVLQDMLKEAATTADMRDTMILLYREIPVDHAPSYRAIFDRLIDGKVPLLLNCAAGKDRTGVGAALILHALGVGRETIIEDYLRTNVHADFSRLMAEVDGTMTALANLPADTLAPLFNADPEYLASSFDEMECRYGGIDRYLEDALGVDAAAKARLREVLVA